MDVCVCVCQGSEIGIKIWCVQWSSALVEWTNVLSGETFCGLRLNWTLYFCLLSKPNHTCTHSCTRTLGPFKPADGWLIHKHCISLEFYIIESTGRLYDCGRRTLGGNWRGTSGIRELCWDNENKWMSISMWNW